MMCCIYYDSGQSSIHNAQEVQLVERMYGILEIKALVRSARTAMAQGREMHIGAFIADVPVLFVVRNRAYFMGLPKLPARTEDTLPIVYTGNFGYCVGLAYEFNQKQAVNFISGSSFLVQRNDHSIWMLKVVPRENKELES